MTKRNLGFAVLQHLYWLASLNRTPSVRLVAERIGVTLREAAEAVSWLDDQGLADATRLRLTLAGLAVAVSSAQEASSSAA